MTDESKNTTPLENTSTDPITGHKPPVCPRYTGCIFFNDKMAKIPDTAESTKDQFCRGNFPTCARYILQSIWKIKAPDDLFPPQMARAQAVYDATTQEQTTVTPGSEDLAEANRTIRLLINTLGHGFMMFDKNGICLPTYSNDCTSLLEIQPVGKSISEILHLNEKQTETMKTAIGLVFNQTHAMSFYEIMHFAPKTYNHSSGSIIKLAYKPDRLSNGALDRIVVIATDITEQIHQQEKDEERKALFESLEQIFHDRSFFGSTILYLNEIVTALHGKDQQLSWETLRREVHTLKGDAGIFKLNTLASHLHDLETAIDSCCSNNPMDIATGNDPCFVKIRELRDTIESEVTSLSNYLKSLLGINITKIKEERNIDKNILYAFANTLEQKEQNALYKDYIRTVCAESFHEYLKHFDTVLKDLAIRFNKKIKPILFVGQDIPIVVDLYQDLLSSFIHIFRNIIDHGVEYPDDRQEAGKDPMALVQIHLSLRKNTSEEPILCLEIEDDGAGIDTNKLRQKFQTTRPNEPWEKCTDQEIIDALLTHNISSRNTVNIYSGRGIGISAVYAKVEELGGTMRINSIPQKKTCVTIEVPYLLKTPK